MLYVEDCMSPELSEMVIDGNKHTQTEVGRAVFFEGEFWCEKYSGGTHNIGYRKNNKETKISGNEYSKLKDPTHLTYDNSPDIPELAKGKVVDVIRTTTIEIIYSTEAK